MLPAPLQMTSISHLPGNSSQVGAFYLSEGYSVCLEGCTDLHGAPVIYANGMPHGSVDEVIAQTVYTYERAMVQAMKRKQELRCTTICNVLNPTFRFPDKAIKASLSVAKLYFPWHARGKTVFVGLPAPIRWTFKLWCAYTQGSESTRAAHMVVRSSCARRSKPFMSREQYESISFANHNDLAALTRHISADNIPQELGGAAQWKMDEYVRRRASAEGVRAPRAPRPYRGKRLDVEQIRALEEVKG